MPDDTFRVLFVCTGNICRSPIAERLLTHRLRERLGRQADRFAVRSAGTWGHEGSAMEPFAEATLRELGVHCDGFVAREIAAAMVASADLVLGATREHRAAAVTLHPAGSRRTFTIREFARLLAGVDPVALPADDPVTRARALVETAARRRGLVRPAHPRDDDVPDPYGAPRAMFASTAAIVDAALRVPLDLLAPAATVVGLHDAPPP